MALHNLAQSVYGDDGYGTSLYAGERTPTTPKPNGLVDTGNPLFWIGLISLSIVIAAVWTLMVSARRKRVVKK